MSLGRSAPARGGGRGGGGAGLQRAGAPSSASSADATMEDELLRVVEREIQENTRALARPSSSAPSSPSSCCPSSPSRLVRGAARRVLGIAMSSSAASSPTRRSPARSPRGEQASSDLAGTSGSAPEVPAGTRSEEEARPEQHQAAHTRSGYGAMMRSALAKIQEGADDSEGQAAFAEMEDAMTGLMELTYGKPELPNTPEPPHEFATKWPRDDADPWHSGVMDDPVILASGYSVDRSYHQWSCPQKNICPVTNETLPHSFIASNHLLRDMIAAWRIDHLTCSSSSTADTLSIPMIPSEEQIQDILQKLSGNSALQKQALHDIQRLSKITKGEQPCLHKWAGLLPELINLRRNWKSTWTQNLEEQRLTIILNLSVHRPNREILAGANQLPDALKKIVDKLHKLGNPVSPLAKVASIVAILSEFDMFRKGILGNGGMGMLRDLLKIEDVVVRKEAIAAIRGLCTDHEGKNHALSHNMPDALLECLMVTDEVLLLLDCLPKDSCVVDKICGKAVELVNIIMVEQGTGLVTPEATYSAISLVHAIVQRDVGKMGQVKNLEDLKDRLRELSSGILPMQTLLQVDRIINVLSEMFPAPARQVQN